MAAIKMEDWGKIYAYMFLKNNNGDASFLNDFENDPQPAVERIVAGIRTDFRVDIDYTHLFEFDRCPPGDLTDPELDRVNITHPGEFRMNIRMCS